MKVISLITLGTLLAFTSATAQQGEYKSIEVAEGVYSFGCKAPGCLDTRVSVFRQPFGPL